MAGALAFVAPGLFGAGGGAALFAAGGGLTALGIGVNLAGSLALSALTRPNIGASSAKPQPNVVQFNIREPVGARRRHYGEVRVGGTVVFFRVDGGTLYRVVVHGVGPVSSIEGVYIVRQPVTLDGSGVVQEAQYTVEGTPRLTILTRDGQDPSTAYSDITAVWDTYTSTARLDGLVTSLTIAEQVPAEYSLTTYPDPDLQIQLQIKSSEVYDPRTGLTAYSDNAALCIADFLTNADGMNLSGLVDYTDLEARADKADESVALAAGGTTARWRIAGSYAFNEQPTAVLRRMLDACGGDVRVTPQGKLRVLVGEWTAPTLILEDADVLEFSQIDDGPDPNARFTEMPFTYVDPDLNFQQVTGDPWNSTALASSYGATITGDLQDFDMCPNHSQARRAAKIKTSRLNPQRIVSGRFQPWVMAAIYEDVVTLDMPSAGLSGDYWVAGYAVSRTDGTVTLRLEQADATAFDWSADQEGEAQTLPVAGGAGIIPTPQGFVAAGHGSSGDGIAAAWVAPSNALFTPRLEYSVAGAGTWTVLQLSAGDTWEQLAGLSGDYDVRLAFETTDRIGAYVTSEDVTAASTTAAPASPTSLTATTSAGVVTIGFTTSVTANLWKTEVRRNGTLIGTFYNGPSQSVSFTDSPGGGSYTYTARSINVGQTANAADASTSLIVS